jgi:hypothetical protein
MIELLKEDERPDWFNYPQPFLRVVERNLVLIDPWWIFDGHFAAEKMNGLKDRYPTRNLVPFAKNQGNDDVACWEQGRLAQVVIVHELCRSRIGARGLL